MMLRQAREAKGVHIEFLASVLRVPVDRLRALEEDRLQDLPDLIFARALAQSVCRQLKIESAPVLAAMPDPDPKHSVRITAATGAPLGGMNSSPQVAHQRMIWVGAGVALLLLWAILSSHLLDDQRPSTSVQAPEPESVPAPMPILPPEPNAAATNNPTPESNTAASTASNPEGHAANGPASATPASPASNSTKP